MRIILILLGLLTMVMSPVIAQATVTPQPTLTATPTPTSTPIPTAMVEPQAVLLQAEDGAFLVGEFYLVDPLRPTIILLHQLYTNRRSWDFIMPSLIGGHYNVLAVDLRGYGDSSKGIDWRKAVTDVQLWFDWIRTETPVRPDVISTMGSSMGSTLAIVGCANDPLCKTAIAISPGWDYYGVVLDDALSVGMANRSTLVIYAERDRWPAVGMANIEEAAQGLLQVDVYPANLHGIDLIKAHQDVITASVLEWIQLHGGG